MKGDFSKWKHNSKNSFNGVLHQQGRVLLDSDWNAQTQITNDWQDKAAGDAFGPGVAAVPAEERDSFKVVNVSLVNSKFNVALLPGRIWADGLLVHLMADENDETNSVASKRIASYLNPDDYPDSNRVAVILEAWREEINGFQMPDELIEPALGGPDTTERVHTAFDLKLLRLGPDQDCENIREALKDDFSKKGNLTVTLEPSGSSDDECPQYEKGGYTGFEHCLYRIEIAKVDDDDSPYFKYSKFNGGLVGRGDFQRGTGGDPSMGTITITGNIQAITSLERDSFYMEIVQKVNEQYWHVIFGAEVTLDKGILKVGEVRLYHEMPYENVFFRLWDGIEKVTEYIDEKELCDGINLKFNQPNDGAIYLPGDYWTFSVRAGEIGNTSPLIQDQPPEGIHYHRVPLALINLDGKRRVITDCRRIFRPLTNQMVCCKITVGDGISTHGDYDSIDDAITNIKEVAEWNGEICLLPGLHRACIKMEDLSNITIRGCGRHTKVIPCESGQSAPVFHIVHSKNITLEHMVIFHPLGTAIELEGCARVEVKDNCIIALTHAIHADRHTIPNADKERSTAIHIGGNKILMLNSRGGNAAIFLQADDSTIKGNHIAVSIFSLDSQDASIENITKIAEPAGKPGETRSLNYRQIIEEILDGHTMEGISRAQGGVQIGSGSDGVKIIGNSIIGGLGSGITLGSDLDLSDLKGLGTDKSINPVDGPFKGFVVDQNDKSLGGILLVFAGASNVVFGWTDDDGNFDIDAQEGAQGKGNSAYIAYPFNIKINQIQSVKGNGYKISTEEAKSEIDLADVFNPIADIQINDNMISCMGLSGIGTPYKLYEALSIPWSEKTSDSQMNVLAQHPVLVLAVLMRRFGISSGFVSDLEIRHNRITHCMQSGINSGGDLDDVIRVLLSLRGEGGISLGICRRLSISNNRIEENGRNYLDPICGIFVSHAEQVDISHNSILNNGSIDRENISSVNGIRGGIVLSQLTPIMPLALLQTDVSKDYIINKMVSLRDCSARIHDNVIKHPVGQALRIYAIGTLSVTGNCFDVHSSLPGDAFSDLAGSILIINRGLPEHLESSLGKHKINENNLLNRDISFSNNQTYLGCANSSLSSQIVVSKGDLGFYNNQSKVLGLLEDHPMVINTFLEASTIRACSNRLKKPVTNANGIYSLVTIGDDLNTTTDNQCDFCIAAVSNNLIQLGNTTIWEGCENIEKFPSESIQKIDDFVSGAFENLRDFQVIIKSLIWQEDKL